jgi:hypothetical protein
MPLLVPTLAVDKLLIAAGHILLCALMTTNTVTTTAATSIARLSCEACESSV